MERTLFPIPGRRTGWLRRILRQRRHKREIRDLARNWQLVQDMLLGSKL